MSSSLEWKTEKRKVKELIPASYNPRKSSLKEVKNLTESITKFNVADPIIINKNNVVIGGHFRLRILMNQGVEEVDVRVPNRELDIKEEKELNIRLNKNTGDWDAKALMEFDKDMLADVGFTDKELTDMLKLDLMEKEKRATPDETNVHELTEALLKFPSKSKYGIPDILPEKIARIPENMETWCKPSNAGRPDPYLVLFQQRNQFDGDREKSLLAFYAYDEVFDHIWKECAPFTKSLQDKKWYAIITPNWSLLDGDPNALMIWNVFKARYIGRYLQEAGFMVIPDICFQMRPSFDFCFDGIPEGATVSVQTQNWVDPDGSEFKEGMDELVKRINPKEILFYGTKFQKEILSLYGHGRRIVFCPAWMEVRGNVHKPKI